MARVIAIGPPVNDTERRGIKTLQEGLRDHYAVLHNFEFKQGKWVYVVNLEKAAAYVQNPFSGQAGFNRSLGALAGLIENTIKGKAKPPSRPEQYGSWVITEKLGGTVRYSEYRARHAFSGGKAATARL